MDSEEFRKFGKAAVDFIADYLDNIRDRQVLPSVTPGYLQPLMSEEPPEEPGKWEDVMTDIHRLILPGMTHWSSPQFHSYFPTASSFPAIVGELLSAGFGCIGFSWIASPVCTELEVVVMNWMGRLLGLPEVFLNCSEGPGGGVIQGSASETTFLCLLAAKERKVNHLQSKHPDLDERLIKSKLVAYTSDQSNSSVEKAGILSSVPMRLIESDENGMLRGHTLSKAIEEDKARGLIPCYVVATFGTTGTCAFDPLEELASVCKENDVWLHVDAAYAGAALACPEFRHLMPGVQFADSFNFNPHKWMLVNFDCSALWVKNSMDLIETFDVQRMYLKDNNSAVPDYRHWQIALGRRFRSLKVWMVMKIYGAEGIRSHLRNQVRLAKLFSKIVSCDERFQIVTESLGLICFRLKSGNETSKALYDKILERKNLYMVACTHKNKFIIRFVICSRICNESDVEFAWNEIKYITDQIEPIENINVKHIKIGEETSDIFIHNMSAVKIEEKSQ